MDKTIEYIFGVPAAAGFDKIFGSWLVYDKGRIFLIDTGVAAGARDLLEKLRARDVRKIDYILISHIHLDHAGGLGQVLEAYPEAKVVVHDKGLKHLVSPGRLWESTQEVMGPLAAMYGEPAPVPKDCLMGHSQCHLDGLDIWETPGHAPHHLSFGLAGHYFAGEAGGCPYYHEGRLYSRPATPPSFFPEVTLNSINFLLDLPEGPAFFGHTPQSSSLHKTLLMYKEQLAFWLDFIAKRPPADNGNYQLYLDGLAEGLFEADPNLAPFKNLAGADLRRERFFMRNSAWGLADHLFGPA